MLGDGGVAGLHPLLESCVGSLIPRSRARGTEGTCFCSCLFFGFPKPNYFPPLFGRLLFLKGTKHPFLPWFLFEIFQIKLCAIGFKLIEMAVTSQE